MNALAVAAITLLGSSIAFTVQAFVQNHAYAHELTLGGWARVLLPAAALMLILKRSDRLAGARRAT